MQDYVIRLFLTKIAEKLICLKRKQYIVIACLLSDSLRCPGIESGLSQCDSEGRQGLL